MLKTGLAFLALAATLALAAPTAEGNSSIDWRERRQIERIRDARRSGDLTAREAARLAAEQARIRAEERRYRRNDGHLGPRERADLQRDLNRASRHIRRQTHDGQER